MITTLLVIRDPGHRLRLAALLEAQPGFECCAQAGSLREACGQLHTSNVDLLLVDLDAPDAADELCWGSLRLHFPATPVVVLFDRYNQALRLAFAAGALDFLPREVSAEDLARCLRDAAPGIPVVPDVHFFERLWAPQTKTGHAAENPGQADRVVQTLTPRERDILRLLAQGAGNQEIAAQLHLSAKTVRNRVSEILSKLGVRNRTQAALWAWEHGLGGRR